MEIYERNFQLFNSDIYRALVYWVASRIMMILIRSVFITYTFVDIDCFDFLTAEEMSPGRASDHGAH